MSIVTIQKIDFELPIELPYTEGHICTIKEAAALNQTWTENLRNNFAPKVKALLSADSDADLTDLFQEFTDYASTYTFATRKVRAAVDPVAEEAWKLAKAAIVGALKSKNIDMKTFPTEKLTKLIGDLLDNRPFYREEAARRVEATQAVADEVLDLISDEDVSEHTPDPEATPAPKAKKSKKAAQPELV